MTTSHQQRFEQCDKLLSATLHSCDLLLKALHDERAAVKSRDPSALNDAVSRKKIHLAELEKHEKQRIALLEACNMPSDLESMKRFVVKNDNNEASLTRVWNATLKRLAECRDANNTNGTIIASQRQMHSDAIDAIRQQEQDPETYGPGGKTETTGQYRALAEV
ncbi:MAG: flagellar protein FlgN [Pseudomonadota bacterium]